MPKPPWRVLAVVAVAVAVIVAICLVVAVFSGGGAGAGSQGSSRSHEAPVAANDAVPTAIETANQVAQSIVSYDLNPADLLAIPASDRIIALSLKDGDDDASQPDEAALTAVRDAVSAIEGEAVCGFVFLDLSTGHCLAYNAGEPVYIASAAKAALAVFALENGAADDEWNRENIESAILYSDNDAFESFGYQYADESYYEWLLSHGVEHGEYAYDLYPKMSASSLASVWAEALQLTQQGGEAGEWFAGLLSNTEVSFIRDGVCAGDDGGRISVMNKGGWIAESDYYSVSDAGVINDDDHLYIMAIVTDQPDGGYAEENVVELARALFSTRSFL